MFHAYKIGLAMALALSVALDANAGRFKDSDPASVTMDVLCPVGPNAPGLLKLLNVPGFFVGLAVGGAVKGASAPFKKRPRKSPVACTSPQSFSGRTSLKKNGDKFAQIEKNKKTRSFRSASSK